MGLKSFTSLLFLSDFDQNTKINDLSKSFISDIHFINLVFCLLVYHAKHFYCAFDIRKLFCFMLYIEIKLQTFVMV